MTNDIVLPVVMVVTRPTSPVITFLLSLFKSPWKKTLLVLYVDVEYQLPHDTVLDIDILNI